MNVSTISNFKSPVAAGAILSITSPYFLIWWATVGASLIIASEEFGAAGFAAFAVAHWLCDLVWFFLLSAVTFRSGKVFGSKFQIAIFAVCGVFLVFMGGMFIFDAANLITSS